MLGYLVTIGANRRHWSMNSRATLTSANLETRRLYGIYLLNRYPLSDGSLWGPLKATFKHLSVRRRRRK